MIRQTQVNTLSLKLNLKVLLSEDQMDLEKVLEVEKRPSGGEHAVEQEQDTESSENNSEIKIKTGILRGNFINDRIFSKSKRILNWKIKRKE